MNDQLNDRPNDRPNQEPGDDRRLRRLLESVRDGVISPDDAARALQVHRTEGIAEGGIARGNEAVGSSVAGFAVVDHDRTHRCGFPEVIFGQGKTDDEIAEIAASLWARNGRLLCTRAAPTAFEAVRARIPEAEYCERARVIHARREAPAARVGRVAIVSAGTADAPVAEEARITASLMDAHVETYYDVGVAGLHRLLHRVDALRAARVVVVVAGMEGALPSVVGGLLDRPVVAVPTSVGYGANFGGLSALLGMLNACAANVCVVNIDNGFGAGYVAALINRAPSERAPNDREPSARRSGH